MKVKVLQHHIDQGISRDVGACAIALALQEQFPEAVVSVGVTFAYVGGRYWEFAGYEARDFVADFDDGLPVSPFEFEMTTG